jgi:hypothetical protein
MRLNTSYCMLYVLIFNKPFSANFFSSKNVYACLYACIFVNMASKCAWHTSKFKLDIAECHFSVIALLVLIFQQFKQSYFFCPTRYMLSNIIIIELYFNTTLYSVQTFSLD